MSSSSTEAQFMRAGYCSSGRSKLNSGHWSFGGRLSCAKESSAKVSIIARLQRDAFHVAEQLEDLRLLPLRQAAEHFHHPLLVRARHLGESLAAGARELHPVGAPVGGFSAAFDQALFFQRIDDAGDVAA